MFRVMRMDNGSEFMCLGPSSFSRNLRDVLYLARRLGEDTGEDCWVELMCPKHGWVRTEGYLCPECIQEAMEEPEPGIDWVTDEPAWGQEDTSEAEAERRKADWDKYWI